MRKQLFAIAALATALTAAPALAQNIGSPAGDRSIGGHRGMSDPGTSGGEDAAPYVTGPSKYNDTGRGGTSYYGMGTTYYYGTSWRERARIRANCAADYSLRGSDYCAQVGM
jgi:hypothetical protein